MFMLLSELSPQAFTSRLKGYESTIVFVLLTWKFFILGVSISSLSFFLFLSFFAYYIWLTWIKYDFLSFPYYLAYEYLS